MRSSKGGRERKDRQHVHVYVGSAMSGCAANRCAMVTGSGRLDLELDRHTGRLLIRNNKTETICSSEQTARLHICHDCSLGWSRGALGSLNGPYVLLYLRFFFKFPLLRLFLRAHGRRLQRIQPNDGQMLQTTCACWRAIAACPTLVRLYLAADRLTIRHIHQRLIGPVIQARHTKQHQNQLDVPPLAVRSGPGDAAEEPGDGAGDVEARPNWWAACCW